MIAYINRNVTVFEAERNIPVFAFDEEWFVGYFLVINFFIVFF